MRARRLHESARKPRSLFIAFIGREKRKWRHRCLYYERRSAASGIWMRKLPGFALSSGFGGRKARLVVLNAAGKGKLWIVLCCITELATGFSRFCFRKSVRMYWWKRRTFVCCVGSKMFPSCNYWRALWRGVFSTRKCHRYKVLLY